ncbi:hypothetical protein NIES2100_77990 [Calothrix sp. NIES-2100]|nr:hypothetical protein NIES2100_77990 [Calothrix sp. NIES-2100]
MGYTVKRSHRVAMRLYPETIRLHRVTMRLYPETIRLYRVTMRLYPDTIQLHRVKMRPPCFAKLTANQQLNYPMLHKVTSPQSPELYQR